MIVAYDSRIGLLLFQVIQWSASVNSTYDELKKDIREKDGLVVCNASSAIAHRGEDRGNLYFYVVGIIIQITKRRRI